MSVRELCYSWWWFALIGSADLASYQTDHPAAEEAIGHIGIFLAWVYYQQMVLSICPSTLAAA
jgi:hypothetical protein